MNPVLQILFNNIVAITCVVFAGLLALRGMDGWGWFLFVAILATTHMTFHKKK